MYHRKEYERTPYTKSVINILLRFTASKVKYNQFLAQSLQFIPVIPKIPLVTIETCRTMYVK